ncbi:Ig-like domain-containing protein [Maioricimonas sp. JC845]|uniref:Ig-like domain-containing protein n=1 Tax=Maioricimonas sp. JC845 TaxID=3232138 RepID=UPI003459E213
MCDVGGVSWYRLGVLLIAGLASVQQVQANDYFPRFSVQTLVTRDSHSTVTIGPDGHLYATTTNSGGREERDNGEGKTYREHLGEVWRYTLDPESGEVTGEERLLTLPGPVNGFVFDPSATADNLVFYITVLNARGHMNRIRVKPAGQDEPVIENSIVVDFLGRGGNHGMNNLVFGPDGLLYANQGGRTFWGTEEDNHTAAVLTFDLKHPDFEDGPISPRDYTLKQMWGGDAPIQIVATGLRNPHGIVRHSNGEFYVTIHDPPRGPLAVGGPIREEVVSDGPPDLVARLKPGAYYGHVNGNRGEWVSYGGNPTAEVDPFEIPEYPVGTMPLPNYDLSLMVGTRRNHCISGIDEYLNGDLVVGYLYARGAEGVNLAGIERFVLDDEGNLTGEHEFLKGADNRPLVFQGVMDVLVTEKGWIYVANFGRRRGDGGTKGSIDLLKPLGGNLAPSVTILTPENRATYDHGDNVEVQVEAVDFDGEVDAVSVLVNGREVPCRRTSESTSTWVAILEQPTIGRYEVRARAADNDDDATTTDPLFLQIGSDVRPPVLTALPSSSAYAGFAYRSQVRAEASPAARFSLEEAPEGMTIDPVTGLVRWSPQKTGEVTARVIADNGTEPPAVRTIHIQVRERRAPEINADGARGLIPGVDYTEQPLGEKASTVSDTDVRSGTTPTLDRKCTSGMVATYAGYFGVETAGRYEFRLNRDAIATLSIGDETILDSNDVSDAAIPLEKGMHAFSLVVKGCDAQAGDVLSVRGPGESAWSSVATYGLYRHADSYGLSDVQQAQPYLLMPRDERDFLPQRLSETGVFSDTASMTLAPGAVPYDVNSPLWSDGAKKDRWVFVPAGEAVTFNEQGPWEFPAGSVFVKHFALGENDTRIETRLTVIKEDGTLYGVTYRWRASQTDADLVTAGYETSVVIDADHEQRWFFPGPEDCMKCHTYAASFVLGMNTRQLNREFRYPATGRSDNQLRALSHAGLFETPVEEDGIAAMDRLFSLEDESATLEQRVRSYLDSNCRQCHTTGGVNANWFADFSTELAEMGVVDAKPLNHMGLSGVKLVTPGAPDESIMLMRVTTEKTGYRMPPLGRLKVDRAGVDALRRWIDQLEPTPEEK